MFHHEERLIPDEEAQRSVAPPLVATGIVESNIQCELHTTYYLLLTTTYY